MQNVRCVLIKSLMPCNFQELKAYAADEKEIMARIHHSNARQARDLEPIPDGANVDHAKTTSSLQRHMVMRLRAWRPQVSECAWDCARQTNSVKFEIRRRSR